MEAPTLAASGLELYPLDSLYRMCGMTPPAAAAAEGEELPEPHRRLLVHQSDMTPTLEAFWGETIVLRTLQRRLDERSLTRLVVLELEKSRRPVEFGAIIIHLEPFPPAAQELIRGCRCPLGSILARHGIRHTSRPRAFFSLQPDAVICEALGMPAPAPLWGRKNVLATEEGETLAEVVEILPPAPGDKRAGKAG